MTESAVQTAPTVLWEDDFSSLDLASDSNPNGAWRPNDTWQPLDKGYADFGAGGSTFNLNPHQSLDGEVRSPFATKTDADGTTYLEISAQRIPSAWHADMGTDCAWGGGFLVTNSNVRSFGYGYYEFKMRLPNPAQGMFPALWLYAASGSKGNAQASGKGGAEVDLLEVFGHAAGTPWNTTLHSAGNNNGPSQIGDQAIAATGDDTTAWHTYGIDWTSAYMRFYKDGRLIGAASAAYVKWLAGLQMDIRLNFAMDANWFPAGQRSTSSTPDGLHMDVAKVKVWSSMPAPAPVTPPAPVPVNANNQTVNLPMAYAGRVPSDHVCDSIAALLTVRGYTVPATGTWTQAHTDQTKLFQKSKGLAVDGVVGTNTWARLLYG